MYKKKFFYNFILPIVLLIVLLVGIDKYIVIQAEKYYPTSGINHFFDNPVKDKGLLLLNLSIKNGNIIYFGSSELNTDKKLHITSNPVNQYPNQNVDKDIDIVGAPGAETLITLIRIGSLDNIQSVPVLFNSSFTWFIDEQYYTKGLLRQFSELQYYQFMKNDKIPIDLKINVSKELSKRLKHNSLFNEAYLYAKLHSDKKITNITIMSILYPYYQARYYFLVFRDHLKAYKLVMKNRNHYVKTTHQIDWENGEENITKRDYDLFEHSSDYFYIYKSQSNILQKRIDKEKNRLKDSTIDNSNEYVYHKWYLNMCSNLNVKSITIFNAVNGYYFDFAGMPFEKRKIYYDKMKGLQKSENLNYIDLEDVEYIPYYFRDETHFASKGWFDINERICQNIK